MDVVSICKSEEYYHNKKNKENNKNIVNKNKENKKTISIKKNVTYSARIVTFDKKTTDVYISKNKVKRTTSKDYDTKNKGKNNKSKTNKEDNYYIGKEEDQLDFELSLEDIENSFDNDSLDLFKYDQIEYFDYMKDNYEDYKPSLHEEEQLIFELTMDEIEDSFNNLSLDLFKVDQLDCDINNINIEAQAYENMVELEFEYSDEE